LPAKKFEKSLTAYFYENYAFFSLNSAVFAGKTAEFNEKNA